MSRQVKTEWTSAKHLRKPVFADGCDLVQAIRAASATVRTKLGVLALSEAQRSEVDFGVSVS